MGIASVNDRSLINDNNAGELVLGTGGILTRYDYLVTQVIEFGIYADDREVYLRTVKNQKPFRLKRDRRRIYWAYQVRTQTDIREIHVQTAMDDLSQEGGHA